MTKLNQLVAVEKGVRAKAQRDFGDAYKVIQKTPLMSGIARSYQPKDEDGDALPPESTLVQVKVGDVLNELSLSLTRMFDVELTKDKTNMVAAADVKLPDGTVLIDKAPVPFLLFLEKQLVDLHTFVSKLPTLDPAEVWTLDPNSGAYVTPPTQTVKTKKIPKNWVKAEATDKHPAQVEIFHEDVVVGYWTTLKYSGAYPATAVAELLDRIGVLGVAVKYAREEANSTEVVDAKAGSAIFTYLFG